MAGMRTGELARRAGVNLQIIRFYERRGLLRKPARSASGHCDYTTNDLESLLFIQWCKKSGFTLKEAQQLGALHVALSRLPAPKAMKKSPDLDAILRIAGEKIADIEERKKSLGAMKRQLKKAIELLRQEAGPVCPASSPKPQQKMSAPVKPA